MSWEDEITEEDIDIKYRDVAHEIGIVNLIKLSKLLGGLNWNVPKKDTLLKAIRDEKILENLKKCTAKEVAKKYGLSEGHIYKISREKKNEDILKCQVNIDDYIKNTIKK